MPSREEIFEQILREHQADRYGLPRLSPKIEWFQELSEALKTWMDSLHWIKKTRDALTEATWAWETLLYCLYTLLVFLIIYGIVLLYRKFTYNQTSRSLSFLPPPYSDKLKELLHSCIENGDWAKAMRIRWALFLDTIDAFQSMTPSFYWQTLSPTHALYKELNIPELYSIMFGAARTDRGTFSHYENILQRLEKKIEEKLNYDS